jgi:hypothetical protein
MASNFEDYFVLVFSENFSIPSGMIGVPLIPVLLWVVPCLLSRINVKGNDELGV